jgi:uncharacterized membrane protein YidH (DUF202 family)
MTRRDTGVQPERTALAWDRTSLALGVNAVLVMRSGLRVHSPALLVVGAVLVGLALALTWVGLVRRRQLASAQPRAPLPALIGLAAAATMMAGACGAWGLLLSI